ncbi:MAG: hypothetical protein N3B13_12390, partial [Deltaproteobacteria bacterium]|nr:hypothetical protein [Deltaproteobacteria bacterium]
VQSAARSLAPLLRLLLRLDIREAVRELKRITENLLTSSEEVSIEEGEIPCLTERNIFISETIRCPECFGYNRDCRLCSGSGKIKTYRRRKVKIPPYSFVRKRIKTDERSKSSFLGRRIVLDVGLKGESISVSEGFVSLSLPLERDGGGRNFYVEIMGRLFEINLPEKISENTVIRLRKLIENKDVNINLKTSGLEKNRCVG